MPRYYFHLTDGKQVLNNHKGIDLPGNAAAREDALALARDLKHGAVMPGWNWTGWFVAIVDQHGHKVDADRRCLSKYASPSLKVCHESSTSLTTVLRSGRRMCHHRTDRHNGLATSRSSAGSRHAAACG